MEHLNVAGGTKIIMVNLTVAYSTLASSFVIPMVASMTIADWVIKILQIAALVFSIKASRNAIKNNQNNSQDTRK